MITAKHMTFGTDGFGMNYPLTAPTDFDPTTEKQDTSFQGVLLFIMT